MGYEVVEKKYQYRFSHLDTIPSCDGQTPFSRLAAYFQHSVCFVVYNAVSTKWKPEAFFAVSSKTVDKLVLILESGSGVVHGVPCNMFLSLPFLVSSSRHWTHHHHNWSVGELCAKVCLLGLHYSLLTVHPYLPNNVNIWPKIGNFWASVQKHENQRFSENTSIFRK